jgi:single-stranded DNA-binding protein
MVEALIQGRIAKSPERRISKAGRPFVTAKVRVVAGEDAVFVGVVAFSEAAQAALQALGEGDSVALAGTLTPRAWIDREGNARPALDMVAHSVLTPYALKHKRKAARGRSGPQRDSFDDDGPIEL